LNTYAYVSSNPLAFIDIFGEQRVRSLPNTFLKELQKQLPDHLIEQGAKTATTPDGFGQAVGRALCKANQGRVKSGYDACTSGLSSNSGCLLLAGADIAAVIDCVNACRDEIKKTCNPNCPP
jgi:hypothetical protein